MKHTDNIELSEAKSLLARIAVMKTIYGKCANEYFDEESAKQFILDMAGGIANGGLRDIEEKLTHDILIFACKNQIEN